MSEYKIKYIVNDSDNPETAEDGIEIVLADNMYHALNKMSIIAVEKHGQKFLRITKIELVKEKKGKRSSLISTEQLDFINSDDLTRRVS